MELSLGQVHFSGAFLLLLVSNLLLWENVASVPECYSHDGHCVVSTAEMFERAIKQAETFRSLAADMYEEFTKRYMKLLIKFMDSWTNPLFHFVTELEHMKAPQAILSKAKSMKESSKDLVADMKWIMSKVHPDAQMKENYPAWPELSSLLGKNKEGQYLAVFNLVSCLRGDSGKTVSHLKFLKCRVTTNKDC
ncbi:prolactin-8A9-like [Nannospalax galili]|uniref:prolactin-8A9-like n=1 Tax=Nannospalax galili TaxID=1026970 RepID=UPI000819F2BA|nr:prolactin-8A9-like [Nannospalax galili]